MSRTGSRICARPYCSKVAAATLSYAYESGSVWLDDLTVDSAILYARDLKEACVDRLAKLRAGVPMSELRT